MSRLFSEQGKWMEVDTALDVTAVIRNKPVLVYTWNTFDPALPERAKGLQACQEAFPEIQVIGKHVQKFGNYVGLKNVRSAARYAGFQNVLYTDSMMSGSIPLDHFWLYAPEGQLVLEGNGNELEGLDSKITKDMLLTTGRPLSGFSRYRATSTMEDFAHLKAPVAISGDKAYSELYIAESLGRRIVITDLEGRVKDVIGTGNPGAEDGPFESCSFSRPENLVYDENERRLYISDRGNGAIRMVDLTTRTVSTLRLRDKDGKAFSFPSAVGSLKWKGTSLLACSADEGACHSIEPTTGSVEEFLRIDGTNTEINKKRKKTQLEELGPVLTSGEWIYMAEQRTNTLLRMDDYRVEVLHSTDPSISADFNLSEKGPASIGDLVWLRDELVVLDPMSGSVWSYDIESSSSDQWEWDDLGSPLSRVTGVVQLGKQIFFADPGRNEVRVLEDGILRPLRISNLDRLLTGIPPRVHVMMESIAPSSVDQTTIKLDLTLPEGMVLDPGHRSIVLASASSEAYIKEPNLSDGPTEIIILPEDNRRQLNLMYDLYLLEKSQMARGFMLPLQVTIPLDSPEEENTFHELEFEIEGRVSDGQRSLFRPSSEGE